MEQVQKREIERKTPPVQKTTNHKMNIEKNTELKNKQLAENNQQSDSSMSSSINNFVCSWIKSTH